MRSVETHKQQPGRSVLLVDLGAHFGGVENYLVNLAALLGRGFQVYALCVLPELAARLRARDVRVFLLPVFPGALKPLRFLAAFALLPVLVLRFRIAVVQVNGLLESLLIAPARLAGAGALYTRHGPFELDLYGWDQPSKRIPREVARLASRFATHVVCVSQAVADSVRPLVPSARVSVIANWIPRQMDFVAPRPALRPKARVLCASRLERYKGIQLLVAAMRELPEVELTIVGDGSYREALEALARDLANIRFTGFQREMEPFYRDADVFVMPSLGPEGLPMASLEAMSRGIPCILSDLPVHREITDDGRGAYLFPSGEAAGLLAGLRALCANAALRSGYAEQGWRIVESRYTEPSARAAYLHVLGGMAHA